MYYFWTVESVIVGKGKKQCAHNEAWGAAAAAVAAAAAATLGGW